MRGYYFITDSGLSRRGNRLDIQAALRARVSVIQYRNKDASTLAMYEEALGLKRLCASTLFIVNDRIDIALAVNADGIHIGQDDMPYGVARELLGENKIIGVTVHTIEEALIAEKSGADYLGVSPIFSTKTKSDADEPAGPELIRKIKARVSIPIVAIGGITLSNEYEVVSTGADALCAISAVVASDDPEKEMLKFQEAFK